MLGACLGGVRYINGVGVGESRERALEWTAKAVAQGDVNAQRNPPMLQRHQREN